MLRIDLSDPTEEGWMTCHVTAEVPGFAGVFNCWLWRCDLQGFRSQLADMIAHVGRPSSAELVGTEPGIDLRLSMDAMGRIEGRYTLQHFDALGSPALAGGFEMDQTYLAPLLGQVDKSLRPDSP